MKFFCFISQWLVSMFRYGAGQLKVMFIGGPNQRKDYHIEEGEEVRRWRERKLVEEGEEC